MSFALVSSGSHLIRVEFEDASKKRASTFHPTELPTYRISKTSDTTYSISYKTGKLGTVEYRGLTRKQIDDFLRGLQR